MPGPLPLLGLRAFAEVGRAGSVKDAAARLGVTAGAVSQQLKQLEAQLGLTLFERRNRELRLTAAGRRLLSGVGESFDRIEEAIEASRQNRLERRPSLTVSTTGAFAATWLVPRLGRFTAIEPRVEVQVHATQNLAPLGTGPGCADVAIRHGLGRWEGVDAMLLMQQRLVSVGSPRLLADGPPIRLPADCLNYPLLHDAAGADWPLWLQALGADHRDPRAARGTRFSDSTLLLRAAVAGQGLALLRDTYVAEELGAGRLQVAAATDWPAEYAYYVVTRPGSARRNPRIVRFQEWLVKEAEATA
jgi:LysR family glycine cleavage system transcriptional activator